MCRQVTAQLIIMILCMLYGLHKQHAAHFLMNSSHLFDDDANVLEYVG